MFTQFFKLFIRCSNLLIRCLIVSHLFIRCSNAFILFARIWFPDLQHFHQISGLLNKLSDSPALVHQTFALSHTICDVSAFVLQMFELSIRCLFAFPNFFIIYSHLFIRFLICSQLSQTSSHLLLINVRTCSSDF